MPAEMAQPAHGATVPPPSPASGSKRSSPRTILLVTGAVFSVVVLLLMRGGLEPSPTSGGGASPVSRPTGGRLVYTVPEGNRMARIWRWNLATNQVSRGPLVRAPVALVNVRSAGYGWLGITSEDGSGSREASFLDSLEPNARTERVGSGDIVTWTRRGSTVLLVERGPLLDRCTRLIDVTAVDVGQPGAETVLRDRICGDVLSVGRTSVGYFMTLLGRGDVNVMGVGYEDAGILLRHHGVIDVAPGGEMLVTPATEFLPEQPVAGGADAPPIAVAGEASRYRLFGGMPVDLLPDAAPLRIERVLAYADGGSRALVDRAARTRCRRALGGAARDRGNRAGDPSIRPPDPRTPPSATYASDGTAFVLTDSRLWHLGEDRLTALALPEGSPTPDGPIAWIVREPITGL